MIQLMLPFHPDIPLIHAADVFRAQGADVRQLQKRRPDIVALAEKAVQIGRNLVKPVVWEKRIAVRSVHPHNIALEDEHQLRTKEVISQLTGASQVVFLIGTLGHSLDNEIQTAMRSDPVWGYMLDSYGSACAEALSNSLVAQIRSSAQAAGLGTSNTLLPGHAGWALDEGQAFIFSILQPDPQLIHLTESAQMLPKKTFSFMIGLGCVSETSTPCDTCNLQPTCPMRREVA